MNMTKREALIKDILGWVSPPSGREERARARLAEHSDEDIHRRHARLKRLEEWATLELGEISPERIAKRRQQIAEDDLFGSDLLSALESGETLGNILDKYEKLRGSAISVQTRSKHLESILRELWPGNNSSESTSELAALYLSIIRREFPRTLQTGTSPNVELSFVIRKISGSLRLHALEVECEIQEINLKTRFDFLTGRADFSIPGVKQLKALRTRKAFEYKKNHWITL